jgi:hypothetical protein
VGILTSSFAFAAAESIPMVVNVTVDETVMLCDDVISQKKMSPE